MEEEEELLIEKLEEIEFENIDEEFIEDNEDDESSEELIKFYIKSKCIQLADVLYNMHYFNELKE